MGQMNAGDDQYGITALTQASQNGHDSIIKILIDNGADVNVVDKERRTPLMMALRDKYASTAKYY